MDQGDTGQINVRDLREHLADYLQQVRAGGSFTVVSRGEPVARLVPIEAPLPRRALFGALQGKIWIADDFDADDSDLAAAAESDIEP